MDVLYSGQKRIGISIKEKELPGLGDHEESEGLATVEFHREGSQGLFF